MMINNKSKRRRRMYKVLSIILLMVLTTSTSTMTLTHKQQEVISYNNNNGYVYDAELIRTVVEDDIIFNSLDACEQLDMIELYIHTIDDKMQKLQSNQSQP